MLQKIQRPKICVPVIAASQEEALSKILELQKNSKVDMVELWLDQIKFNKDIKSLLKQVKIPVLCVNKKPEDHGSFEGSDEELVNELLEAAENWAYGISVPTERLEDEIANNIWQQLQTIINETGRKINFSAEHHYWNDVPSFEDLIRVVKKMCELWADTIKLVFNAKTQRDTAMAFSLSQQLQSHRKSIILAMWKEGEASRLNLNNEIMFGPVLQQEATAPGQLSVDELYSEFNKIINIKNI